jgi:hypothetical protein
MIPVDFNRNFAGINRIYNPGTDNIGVRPDTKEGNFDRRLQARNQNEINSDLPKHTFQIAEFLYDTNNEPFPGLRRKEEEYKTYTYHENRNINGYNYPNSHLSLNDTNLVYSADRNFQNLFNPDTDKVVGLTNQEIKDSTENLVKLLLIAKYDVGLNLSSSIRQRNFEFILDDNYLSDALRRLLLTFRVVQENKLDNRDKKILNENSYEKRIYHSEVYDNLINENSRAGDPKLEMNLSVFWYHYLQIKKDFNNIRWSSYKVDRFGRRINEDEFFKMDFQNLVNGNIK